MLNNMKIGPKLIGGFVVVALIAAIIGVVGYSSLGALSGNVNEIGNNRLPGVQAMLGMSEAQYAVLMGERGLINEKMSRDPQVLQAQYEFIEEAWNKADEAYKVYEKLPRTDRKNRCGKSSFRSGRILSRKIKK
jgi:methyl-accepting chemotaxis protein